MVLLVVIGILQLAALGFLVCYVVRTKRAVEQKVSSAMAAFQGFVSPSEGGGPSPLALTTQALAKVAASEFTQSLKASLMGHASGLARTLDGAQADVTLDAITGRAPLLGLLLDFSPSLRKRVGKLNPLAAMALSNALSGLGKKPGGGDNGKAAAVSPQQMGLV